MRRYRSWLFPGALALVMLSFVALAANTSGGPGVLAKAPPTPPTHHGPVEQENKKPGSTRWQSAELARGRIGKVDEEEGHGAKAHPNGGHGLVAPQTAQPQVAGANSGGGAAGAAPNTQSVWTDTEIRGYSDLTSVNHGGAINFMVSTTRPKFDLEVYRMGWYGGTG